MKVLLIEDEPELRDSVASSLQLEGHICETSNTLLQSIKKLESFEYDIILLDITLPDGNGISLLKHIRRTQPDQTHVLIISAKNSLDDKLTGLDEGADDYITKPFHNAELNSKINAIIRRRNTSGFNQITFNEIIIELNNKEVIIHNKPIILTKKEYEILLYLITNKNRIITKETLAEHLWGDHMDMADNFDFVYTHVKNLRRKMESAGSADYLKNVYGMGYKFTDR